MVGGGGLVGGEAVEDAFVEGVLLDGGEEVLVVDEGWEWGDDGLGGVGGYG